MQPLSSFLEGRWIEGTGPAAVLVNPSTEEPLAEIRPAGSLARAVTFARERGGPALRALTFAERGELLRGLVEADPRRARRADRARDRNGGNTRGDAKFDIDGAIGTLVALRRARREARRPRASSLDGEPRPARALGAPGGPARPGAAARASRCTSTRSTSRPGASPRRRRARCSPACRSSPSRRRRPRWWRTASSSCSSRAGAARGRAPAPARAASATCSITSAARTCSRSPARATPAPSSGRPAPWSRATVRVNVEADSLNAAVLGPDVGPGSEHVQAVPRRRRCAT